MTTIAAIVVSLPERHDLLVEALGSVRNQTRQPDDMVIGVDFSRLGEVPNMNRLIRAVERSSECEWLAFLHDDDIWMPDHLAVCEQHFSDDVDVVVSRFKLVGRPVETIEPWHDDFNDLRFTNWIGSPSMMVVRAEVFGEFSAPCQRHHWIDWCNLNRLLSNGARFVDTKQVTTQYRFMGSNGSWNAS